MRLGKSIFYMLLVACLALLASSCASGQRGGGSKYTKFNRSYFKRRYAANTVKSDVQCSRLRKKKSSGKNRHVVARSAKKPKSVPLAEVDINDTPPPPKPATKPAPKPTPKAQPIAKAETKPEVKPEKKTELDNMNLEEKHLVEDIVLLENKLPAPTSEEHEKVRKEVEKHLKNFDKEKPIKLEPLYFITGQDEFAFVDMEPFLVAVEYALQGKHILIEGHTDHVGDYEANVALSIKRVEKIRELMLQMGVHDDHISVVGYGEELSTEAISTDKKQEERRVDFTVF